MTKIKFEDLNLSKEISRAAGDMGFEEATPIQAEAIPCIMEGRDVIGQAQTGTGKTAAFGIPILEKLDLDDLGTQVLALCPTRELAIQVAEELKKLSKYKEGVGILPIYGGQPIDRQIKALKRRKQIIIGTPGRIMDHMRRKTIKLENIKTVILDEADEMLDMGFREDIETILEKTPEERQTILFSATMPKEILELTKKYQKNAQLIKVVRKELTVPMIEQVYFEVKEKIKTEVLCRLLDMYNPKLTLIFCNTKRKVDELVSDLQLRGFFADAIHGDLKQQQRDRVMAKFRSGTIDILVATDVAARGIDVDDIEAVFNYDVPQDEEYYVHRIGRTGRAGRAGRAFTFVVGKEVYKIKDIQRYAKTKIMLQQVPSVDDVQEIRSGILFDKVKATIEEGHLGEYVNLINKLMEEDYVSLDIAAALLKIIKENETSNHVDDEDYGDTGASPGMVRLFINIGRKHKIGAKDIVGSIAGNTGLAGNLIGTIDIYDRYTFVEIPREHTKEVLSIMKNNQIKGSKINIEPANRKQ
jgi:ATP-dependent RNA helicase DeaD